MRALSLRSEAAPEPRRFYSVAEIARMLGMSKMTVYRAIAAGEFPAVKVRGRLIVPARAGSSASSTQCPLPLSTSFGAGPVPLPGKSTSTAGWSSVTLALSSWRLFASINSAFVSSAAGHSSAKSVVGAVPACSPVGGCFARRSVRHRRSS